MPRETPRPELGDDPNPYRPPAAPLTAAPSPIKAAGPIDWPFWLGVAFFAGPAFGLGWSLFMAFALGRDLASILLGGGIGLGLLFGPTFGAAMAIAMRPSTTTLPVAEPADGVARVDAALLKLRYRLLDESGGVRRYRTRALLRPRSLDITTEVTATSLVLTGPKANLAALCRAIAR